jgi:hypothetical protein
MQQGQSIPCKPFPNKENHEQIIVAVVLALFF